MTRTLAVLAPARNETSRRFGSHRAFAGGWRAAALLWALSAVWGLPALAERPSIEIVRAAPDPAHQAVVAVWWDRYQAARPALERVVETLRRERARWRGAATAEGCRRALRELAGVDRRVLTQSGDYRLAVQTGRALDELEGAARACVVRRYFELDYRLRLAEEALATARRQAADTLAR